MQNLSGGQKFILFADIRNMVTASSEARDFGTGKEYTDAVKAIGLIVRSVSSRVIGSFFIGLNKPSYPTKLFTSEEKAINWLKGFKK